MLLCRQHFIYSSPIFRPLFGHVSNTLHASFGHEFKQSRVLLQSLLQVCKSSTDSTRSAIKIQLSKSAAQTEC